MGKIVYLIAGIIFCSTISVSIYSKLPECEFIHQSAAMFLVGTITGTVAVSLLIFLIEIIIFRVKNGYWRYDI